MTLCRFLYSSLFVIFLNEISGNIIEFMDTNYCYMIYISMVLCFIGLEIWLLLIDFVGYLLECDYVMWLSGMVGLTDAVWLGITN